MTHVLTIKTNDTVHFEQIKNFAQKLGAVTTERRDEIVEGNLASKRFLDLQRDYPPRKISADIDINAIIDESNL